MERGARGPNRRREGGLGESRAARQCGVTVGCALAVLLGGVRCDCGGGDGGASCRTATDCPDGWVCVAGHCVRPDAGTDANADAEAEAGDGVETSGETDAPTDDAGCPSGLFCGSPPACCAAGDECIEGLCVPPCASGVRCGATLDLCCAAAEVCLGEACTAPGDPCADSFDCPEDFFCEPTLGRCLPQLDPLTCEVRRTPEPFEVLLEWSWTGSTTAPTYDQPIAAPVVIDLDGDRDPEVLVSCARQGDWQDAVLRALDGDDGTERWAVDAAAWHLNGRASIAAGDIDGDGRPEIVGTAASTPSAILAFEHDGTPKWRSTDAAGNPTTYDGISKGIALADLDGDGSPEVVAGGVVLDANGRERWSRGGMEGDNNYGGGQPTVADLDLNTVPEVVTGARVWQADGTLMWDGGAPDGYPAVADFAGLGLPFVAVVGNGTVRILRGADGSLFWGPVSIPGGGRGGPPTVADFDGDGRPEIGVAGGASYSVYDPDGAEPIRWSRETQDESSNATGSSVFDFEGDGVAEVVYCDECFMRVYRGIDGEVLLEIPNSSATINEYPLVVDVDGDGNSEIVVVANDSAARTPPFDRCFSRPGFDAPRHGVFAYGDAHDRWVRTRRIWNQHAYHVTNVAADGSIPRIEENNWTTAGLNNFRQNVQGSGVYNAPDLTVIGLAADLTNCPASATLAARVANRGSLGVAAGIPVAFYEGTLAAPGPLLGVVRTAVPLLPGASTLVTLDVPLGPGPTYAFFVVVDDDGAGAGTTVECDETNNRGSIADLDCLLL